MAREGKKRRKRGRGSMAKKKINIKQRIILKNSSHVPLLPVNNKSFLKKKKKRNIPGF